MSDVRSAPYTELANTPLHSISYVFADYLLRLPPKPVDSYREPLDGGEPEDDPPPPNDREGPDCDPPPFPNQFDGPA